MKNSLKYLLLALALVLGTSSFAHADDDDHGHGHGWKGHDPKAAPEVDPGMAITGISLVAGMLTVLSTQRRKQ